VVAPKVAAVANIESALYGMDQIDLTMVARGGLRMTEFSANDIKIDTMADLDLPDGAHIVAVQRGDDVLLPRREMEFENEDSLLFLIESEDVRKEIQSRIGIEKKEKETESPAAEGQGKAKDAGGKEDT
jgi:Trk K+ transport system NAD-binding subunit